MMRLKGINWIQDAGGGVVAAVYLVQQHLLQNRQELDKLGR